MVEQNGFQDSSSGTWIDFGTQLIIQDGLKIWATTLQSGPYLDVLSDKVLKDYYAKDGLHFHSQGYNLIGQAWAETLKAPIRTIKVESAK